jgi:hypothetical protein
MNITIKIVALKTCLQAGRTHADTTVSEAHSCKKLIQSDQSEPFPIIFFYVYTDKKVNQIFLIYKEIQSGAVAKSYMRKDFLIFEEMRKYFPIYDFATAPF